MTQKPMPKGLRAKSTDEATPISPELNLSDLSNLATWLEGTGLEEVEVETIEYRIRLKKPSVGMTLPPAAPVAAPAPAVTAPAPVLVEDSTTFKSPMVGTFYRSSSPESAPFVKEGDNIAVGQVLGIIEAMKTMNQITADRAGTLTRVIVGNAQPVEFGQPLFVIA